MFACPELLQTSGSCLTSEHALNQEHALCTWMWIIISKLAVVVLCLHFTLTHFFCLTTPLSDRWVSIYESLSQPSLNSLPLAYHFDLYQLTLFCFPCFICISLWREKQREWGWWFPTLTGSSWLTGLLPHWSRNMMVSIHGLLLPWPALKWEEERLGRGVEEKKWSKMSEGRVEPQDRGGTEREEREDIGGTERKRRRGGRRNGKSVSGRRTLTKRDHREKEKKLVW